VVRLFKNYMGVKDLIFFQADFLLNYINNHVLKSINSIIIMVINHDDVIFMNYDESVFGYLTTTCNHFSLSCVIIGQISIA